MSSLYQVLGVTNNASDKEIKSAYLKLARQLHPDRNVNNPQAVERFKKVSEAYSVLGNPNKRREYDQELQFGAAGYGNPGYGQGGFRTDVTMEDVMRQFQGGQSTGGRRIVIKQGGFGNFEDILRVMMQEHGDVVKETEYPQIALTLNFEEAALGCEKNIRLANGRIIRVKLDAGINNNQQVRFNLPSGESFFAKIKVKEHATFTREGLDIYLTARIGEKDWHNEINIPTIHGMVKVKILPSHLNKSICLRGKGIVLVDGSRGNQYVKIRSK